MGESSSLCVGRWIGHESESPQPQQGVEYEEFVEIARPSPIRQSQSIGLAVQDIKLGKNSVQQLAKLLPQLETLDVGFYSHNTKATDSDLIAATEQFVNLTALRTDMWNVTSFGIANFARAMGEQLLDLRIYADTTTKHYLSGEAMEAITTSCPNLKYFPYRACQVSAYWDSSLDGVTGDRVIRLLKGCRRLESLELEQAFHVKQTHFVEIAQMVANGLDEFALRKMVITVYSGINPSGTIDESVTDPFNASSLLEEYTFLHVEDKWRHPKFDKGVMFMGVTYYGSD